MSLGVLADAASAAPITVAPTTFADTMPADTVSVGLCATPGATPCSLREAINLVQNHAGGGTVDLTNALTPLTYQVSNGPLLINAGGNPTVTIAGPNPRLVTVTDKNATTASNVFAISTGTVTISGVTITGGAATAGPGGAANGGAIANSAVLTLNGDQISGNTATAPLVGSAAGGAIFNSGALTLSNSTVSGNTAASGMGTSAAGGGIANTGTLNVTNTTITGNTASGSAPTSGGGISQTAGTMVLASVTLNGNTVTSSLPNQATGGNLAGVGSSTQAQNTIISGGTATAGSENCTAHISSLGYNLEDKNQCGFTAAGDQVSIDPQLQPLGASPNGNNFTDVETVAATSTVIDRGNPAGCTNAVGAALSTDQVGNARGTPCDIGAYETSLPPVIVSGPTVAGTPQLGHQLSCTGATFSGIAPITQKPSWLRNGVAIAGASAATYSPAAADLGQALACAVTATNVDGSVTATSAAVGITLPPLPPFDGVTLLKTAFTLRNSQIVLPVMCSRVAVYGCVGTVKVSVAGSATTTAVAARKKKRRAPRVPHPVTLGTATFRLGNSQVGTIPVLISHDGKLEIASRPRGRQAVTIQIVAYDGLGRPKLTSYRGQITAPAPKKKARKR